MGRARRVISVVLIYFVLFCTVLSKVPLREVRAGDLNNDSYSSGTRRVASDVVMKDFYYVGLRLGEEVVKSFLNTATSSGDYDTSPFIKHFNDTASSEFVKRDDTSLLEQISIYLDGKTEKTDERMPFKYGSSRVTPWLRIAARGPHDSTNDYGDSGIIVIGDDLRIYSLYLNSDAGFLSADKYKIRTTIMKDIQTRADKLFWSFNNKIDWPSAFEGEALAEEGGISLNLRGTAWTGLRGSEVVSTTWRGPGGSASANGIMDVISAILTGDATDLDLNTGGAGIPEDIQNKDLTDKEVVLLNQLLGMVFSSYADENSIKSQLSSGASEIILMQSHTADAAADSRNDPYYNTPGAVTLVAELDSSKCFISRLRFEDEDGEVLCTIDVNSADVTSNSSINSFESDSPVFKAFLNYELTDVEMDMVGWGARAKTHPFRVLNGNLNQSAIVSILQNQLNIVDEATREERGKRIAEAKAVQQDEAITNILKRAVNKEFSTISAYDKWCLLIAEYFDGELVDADNQSVTYFTKEFIEGNFALTVSSSDNPEAFDLLKLNDYYNDHKATDVTDNKTLNYGQYLQLYSLIQLNNKDSYFNNIAPVEIEKYVIADGAQDISNGSTTAYDVLMVGEYANQIYDNADQNVQNPVKNIKGIVSYSGDMVKYLTAQVYGYRAANPFEDVSDAEGNDSAIENQLILNNTANGTNAESSMVSLIPSLSDEMEDRIGVPFMMPALANVGQIAGTSKKADGSELYNGELSAEAFMSIQHVLTLLYTYSVSYSGITKAEEGSASVYSNVKATGYYCAELEDTLSSMLGANNFSDIADSAMRSKIACYIQIAKAVDFLGVDAAHWSKEVWAICEYYNTLISFDHTTGFSYTETTTEPLSQLFNVTTKELAGYYQEGVALSSTYVPLQTNVYDVSSISTIEDLNFVTDFHYPFGFYRKALYIDTNVNAAVDRHITGAVGSTRVARLKDMFEPEKDIVLYLDDNFYNVNVLSKLQGYAYEKTMATEEDEAQGIEVLTDWWTSLGEADVEAVVKTGSVTQYSMNIRNETAEFDTGGEQADDVVLSSSKIKEYLTVKPQAEINKQKPAETGAETTGDNDEAVAGAVVEEDESNPIYDEYTPLQSFAVTSAIYRHGELLSGLNSYSSGKNPVFISSPNLAAVEGVSRGEFNTVYNYMMLKNLDGNLGIDYKSVIDMDSPLYMDIYGNILTESGLVVIPAIANATLVKPAYYMPYTVAFVDLYANGYHLPTTYNNADKFLGDNAEVKELFVRSKDETEWVFTNREIYGYAMDFSNLAISDSNVVKALQTLTKVNIAKGALDFWQHAFIITEVLRGAPLENIDKDFEGLGANSSVSKTGIYLAKTVEELGAGLLSTANGNSFISLPNLAYAEYVEYIVLFLYKIAFAVALLLLLFSIYKDAVGLKAMARFIITVVSFVMIIYAVPKLMDVSYYQANRQLLQDEVTDITLLNLEKRYEGKEIGMTSVTAPSTETKLYVKLDEISIPWYNMLGKILESDVIDSLNNIMDAEFKANALSTEKGVIKKSNGLYMDINTIFDATSLSYVNDTNGVVSQYVETPVASYFLPYYAILDTLVNRMNNYNYKNHILSYTTRVQNGGTVRTLGLAEAFFTSDYFMEQSVDPLGLYDIYGYETTLIEKSVFTPEDRADMKLSLWYADAGRTEQELKEVFTELAEEARQFVIEYRGMLGKISDEAFLKVFALTMAIKYNDLVGVPFANTIEIYDIDTEDILRLAVADKNTVMAQSSKSFARFVYTNSSSWGVMFTAVLMLLYFISGPVKTVILLGMIAIMTVSMVVRKLFRRDGGNSALQGFILTMGIICGINVLYALVLKVSLMLPGLGWSMEFYVLVQIVLQCVYLFLLAVVFMVVLRDWTTVGATQIKSSVNSMIVNRLRFGRHASPSRGFSPIPAELRKDSPKFKFGRQGRFTQITGREIYQLMQERDSERLR